jgi:hypothetical protein
MHHSLSARLHGLFESPLCTRTATIMDRAKQATTRDAVRVVCRVRPENEIERSRGGASCVRIHESSIEVTVRCNLSVASRKAYT